MNKKMEVEAELKTWKDKFSKAETFLSQAAEKKALLEKAKQQKEFDAFQVTYNTMKGKYDGFMVKENEGTLTDNDRAEMKLLEAAYMKDKGRFDEMER